MQNTAGIHQILFPSFAASIETGIHRHRSIQQLIIQIFICKHIVIVLHQIILNQQHVHIAVRRVVVDEDIIAEIKFTFLLLIHTKSSWPEETFESTLVDLLIHNTFRSTQIRIDGLGAGVGARIDSHTAIGQHKQAVLKHEHIGHIHHQVVVLRRHIDIRINIIVNNNIVTNMQSTTFFLIERIVDHRRTILVCSDINGSVQHTVLTGKVVVNPRRTAVLTRIQSGDHTFRAEIDIGMHEEICPIGDEIVVFHRHVDIRVNAVVHDDVIADMQTSAILLVNREISPVVTNFESTHIHRVVRHTLITIEITVNSRGATVLTRIHRNTMQLRGKVRESMEEYQIGICHIVILRHCHIDVAVHMVINHNVVTEGEIAVILLPHRKILITIMALERTDIHRLILHTHITSEIGCYGHTTVVSRIHHRTFQLRTEAVIVVEEYPRPISKIVGARIGHIQIFTTVIIDNNIVADIQCALIILEHRKVDQMGILVGSQIHRVVVFTEHAHHVVEPGSARVVTQIEDQLWPNDMEIGVGMGKKRIMSQEVVSGSDVRLSASVVDDHVVAHRQRATVLLQEGVARLRSSVEERRDGEQDQQQETSHLLFSLSIFHTTNGQTVVTISFT